MNKFFEWLILFNFWMNKFFEWIIRFCFLNWILNWMVFDRYSMFEWIIKIYRPGLPNTEGTCCSERQASLMDQLNWLWTQLIPSIQSFVKMVGTTSMCTCLLGRRIEVGCSVTITTLLTKEIVCWKPIGSFCHFQRGKCAIYIGYFSKEIIQNVARR